MRKMSLRPAAVLLALTLAVCLPGRAAVAQNRERETPRRTLLLFPFDFTGASVDNASEVIMLLTDVARSRLLASRQYGVIQFYRTLPTVARLHNEQQLTDSDVTPPFAEDNLKAVKIAKLADYELVFVGSIDSYTFNEANRQVEVTVSGRLVEVDPNAAAGKVLKSATLTAASAQGGQAAESERALDAARSAGEKLMTQLVPTVAPPEVTPGEPKPKPRQPGEEGKKKKRTEWWWGLAAVAIGVGIGLISSGGHGGRPAGSP